VQDPTVVPRNVESRVHSEENKANDGMQAIQASEEEIVDEVEKEEIQNDNTNVNHEEIETKLVDEEASGLQDLSFHPKVSIDTLKKFVRPNFLVKSSFDKLLRLLLYSKRNKWGKSVIQVVDDKLATEQNGAEVETDSNEEMATGYTAVTESAKLGEAICDKVSGQIP
jgi:hypothetical protein